MTKYTQYSDEQLVEMLRASDETAYTEIYLRYWKRLYSVAVQRISDHHEAQEIIQKIFLNLWRKRESIELKYSMYTFLSAAVKYEIINEMTAKARRIRLTTLVKSADEQIDETNHVDLKELQEIIHKLIGKLPSKSQQVYLLSREAGLSNRKIADKLGLAEKTVEGHITYALRQLRAAINSILTGLICILLYQGEIYF